MVKCREPHCENEANPEGYGLCDKHQLWYFLAGAEYQAKRLGMPVSEMLAKQWLGVPPDKAEES